MDFPPPDFFTGASSSDGRPSPTRKELQGPRPTPLKLNRDSYKIKKPPVAPLPHHHPPPSAANAATEPPSNPQTVIIYAVSPKVYHTTVSDFMSVVQRLTGPETSTSGAALDGGGSGGSLSPAARLATIEKATSPVATATIGSNDVLDIIGNSSVEMGHFPGILSPAPATLPPVSPPGFFSPLVNDPFMTMMLSPSPSTLFSAPLISPSPNASDLFHPFFDF